MKQERIRLEFGSRFRERAKQTWTGMSEIVESEMVESKMDIRAFSFASCSRWGTTDDSSDAIVNLEGRIAHIN